METRRVPRSDSGAAFLLTLIALSLVSLLSLYVALNASTELRISDNHETQIQSTCAAIAGLRHARALIRGLALDDLLRGPDGTWSADSDYLSGARKFGFRNPVDLASALSLNILEPGFAGSCDDGVISTGLFGTTQGIPLIPPSGIAFEAPNPYGAGTIVNARYFVKVTDNNGEASEIAGDPLDNPFTDGDGIVIVRSIGVSRTFSEKTGSVSRLNSVAVFEARLRRFFTFDIGPALVTAGNGIEALFAGTYEIAGGAFPGIGTIDPDPDDGLHPDQIVRAAAGEDANITGAGEAAPSVRDISGEISSMPDKALLLDANYLWMFVHDRAPGFADSYFEGDQDWAEGSAPYAGSYDATQPWNAPGQDPRVTVVNGDLHISGGFDGGGLLVVTGGLHCSGPVHFSGLVLVVGTGSLTAEGTGAGIEGGILVAGLEGAGGTIVFGTPRISISGNSRFVADRNAVRMALGLIPAAQIGFREIAGLDP